MKFRNLSLIVIFLSSFSLLSQVMLYKKIQLEGETRLNDLLQRMSLDEKIDLVSGMRMGKHGPGQYDGTKGNNRLEIAPFKIYHGPYGVNASKYLNKNGTYYPVSINMASTWNPYLVEETMNSLSKELSASGGQSNAGPAMNIIRDLRGGRSSEYFTEDPYLNGKIASSYVRGIQSQRNIAIIKHFICNNQERERNYMDVTVGERALREIYLPGFKRAVKEGGALGVMTGYNSVNGKQSSENQHLIKDVLKGEWGFQGLVMTDWTGSGTSAESMIQAGLDLEMPRPLKYTKEAILKAIDENQISETHLNEMVRRILVVAFVTGVVDDYRFEIPEKLATKESLVVARKMAEESLVLLQNTDGILPLDSRKTRSIAVIGPNGDYGAHFREGKRTYQMLQGGGSASVAPRQNAMITPYKGLKSVGSGIKIAYEPGCYGEHGCTEIKSDYFITKENKRGLNAYYYGNDDLEGKPEEKIDQNIAFEWHKAPDVIEANNVSQGGDDKAFSVRWRGKIKAPNSRLYTFEIQSQGIVKVYINKKLVVNKRRPDAGWDRFAMGSVFLEKGDYDIRVEFKKTTAVSQCKLLWDYGNDEYLAKAVVLAKKSKVVIMPLGTSGLLESEAVDRDEKLNRTESLSLSLAQEQLIDAVYKVNKNIIVVTYTAGVVCDKWKDKVKGIIYAGFPGQEGGYALANIVFGNKNPSGKLPVSIPKSVNQYPDGLYSYNKKIEYKDGIYVGYRYFEKNNLIPSFPFGHGLSYTNFTYSNLTCIRPSPVQNNVTVRLEVKNTGSKEGKEVVQFYVSDLESTIDRPKKELKYFKKIHLEPGESKIISFILEEDAFAYYNVEKNKWEVEPGDFNIMAGSSSTDIRQTALIKL